MVKKQYIVPTTEIVKFNTMQLMGLDSVSNNPDPGASSAPKRRMDPGFAPAF